MRKIVLLSIISALAFASCSIGNKGMAGKSYRFQYLYMTAGNEYGKGGGGSSIMLDFGPAYVEVYILKELSLPDSTGAYHAERNKIRIMTSGYKVFKNQIKLDSDAMPVLKKDHDTNDLIAPEVDFSKLVENNSYFKEKVDSIRFERVEVIK